jgi:hypothetical protein
MNEIANKIEKKTNPKKTRCKYQTCLMKNINEITNKIQKEAFNRKQKRV